MKQNDIFLNLNYDFLRADKGTGGRWWVWWPLHFSSIRLHVDSNVKQSVQAANQKNLSFLPSPSPN